LNWFNLTQNRYQWRRALVSTVMNIQVPENVGKFSSGLATGGLSRRTQLHGVRIQKI
jgi:hypothetical protein